MKTNTKPFEKAGWNCLLFFTITLFLSCNKSAVSPVNKTILSSPPNPIVELNMIGLKVDSGYCYKLGYDLPVFGDSNEHPDTSTLRLFENGVELGPAHAGQKNIRLYGLGQFTHWNNKLYFSTSDNSNPLSNGRKYSYRLD